MAAGARIAEIYKDQKFSDHAPVTMGYDWKPRWPNTPTMGTRMNTVFATNGVGAVLHPLVMVSIAWDPSGESVGSLAQKGQLIADALDEVLTWSWG